MRRSPFQVLILLGFLLLVVGCGSSAPSKGTIPGCATLSSSSVPAAGSTPISNPLGLTTGPGSLPGITVGPDGALWFTESGDFAIGGNKIGCITTKGKIIEFTLPSS